MIKKICIYWKSFFQDPSWIISKRVLILVFSLPVLCFLALIWYTVNKITYLEELSCEVTYLEKLVNMSIPKIEGGAKSTVAVNYVEDVLGKMDFLSKDQEQLLSLYEGVSSKDLYPEIKERYFSLAGDAGRLNFSSHEEGDVITWDIKNPVEMSLEDFSRLLMYVEGPIEDLNLGEVGLRPDIYFSKLELKRTYHPIRDIYSVDLQILQKREP